MLRWAVVVGKFGSNVDDTRHVGVWLGWWWMRECRASGESPAPPWLVPTMAAPEGIVSLLGGVVLGAPALLLSSSVLVPLDES